MTNAQRDPPQRFLVTLEARAASRAAIAGLRRWLKAATRNYGLKCVSIKRLKVSR